MNFKKTVLSLSVLALIAAVALGVVAYSRANAQEATPTTPSTTAPGVKGLTHPGPGLGVKGGYSNEDLANALGITVDELTAAYEKANDTALDQAVAAGLITQAQADDLRSNGAVFPFGRRWGGWLSQNGIDYEALLADALGISTEELQSAYAEAYNARIDQALADGSLTQEQADLLKGEYALRNSQSFQTAMQSAFEAAVNQAVADGVITQAQADLILQNSSGKGFWGFGGGHGHRGGRFGHFGGFDSIPAIPDTSTAPSSGL